MSRSTARSACGVSVKFAVALRRLIPTLSATAVLVHFHTLVLKRTHKRFSYRNFSVGNGFLAGARDMLGGLPSAIFMFQALTNSQVREDKSGWTAWI